MAHATLENWHSIHIHFHNLNNKLKTSELQTLLTMSQTRFIVMAFPCLTLVLLLHTLLPICNGLSLLELSLSETDIMTKRVCTKSIGECLAESEMDSETNRRVLEGVRHRYISYETLKRDMVPCDRAGASYYNCHARPANPYSRGCEVITRCARGVQGIKTWLSLWNEWRKLGKWPKWLYVILLSFLHLILLYFIYEVFSVVMVIVYILFKCFLFTL